MLKISNNIIHLKLGHKYSRLDINKEIKQWGSLNQETYFLCKRSVIKSAYQDRLFSLFPDYCQAQNLPFSSPNPIDSPPGTAAVREFTDWRLKPPEYMESVPRQQAPGVGQGLE